jgi:outer membrane protein TolC
MGGKNVTAAVTASSIGERSSGARGRAAKLFAALACGVGWLSMCTAAPAAHAQNLAPTRTIMVGSVQPGTVAPTAAAPARAGDPAQVARQDDSQGAPEPAIQLVYPPKPPEQTGPPLTLTLADALQRAQKYNPEYLSAVTDQKSAQEDRLQARNARLPQVGIRSGYLGTQGNGKTANGRFVTQDGVHVYQEWVTLHQDISANSIMGTDYKRAQAAEAIAAAKAEIARRGLTVTVTKTYYALVVAQRKYATAQQALEQARRFLQIAQQLERAGQAAHSDVIKAQIQEEQQEAAYSDANLAMEDTRLDLAVLLFPALDENFTAVDDLDQPQPLPMIGEVQNMASRMNPDIGVALQTLRSATQEVTASKTAFLPAISLDPVWGLEANCVALNCVYTAIPEAGATPTLGYFITASLTMPVWDWGTLRSKLRQAEFKQQQAQVELSAAQRHVLGELYAAYNEALVARDQVDKLRQAADLAAESLRLVTLRYQAGESPALELVDAQTTLIAARNAYDDAEVRYRTALATLQTFTGSF